MSRTGILGKVRAALGADPAELARRDAVAARLAEAPRHLVPAAAKRQPAELQSRFAAALRAQGADVVTVAAPGEVPGAVAGYLGARSLPLRARCGSDPQLLRLPWREVPSLILEQGPAHAGDGAGLSRAVAGVAETGTLVFASGPHNPVTLAFVADTHLVVVDAAAIVGCYEDAMAFVAAACGFDALPRTLNFISGPSRTGDIGGRIVMGAHGPRRLAVFVVAQAGD